MELINWSWGVQKDGRFLYVESVKNGFLPTTRRLVQDAIEKLRISECPFNNLPEKKAALRWVEKNAQAASVKPKI